MCRFFERLTKSIYMLYSHTQINIGSIELPAETILLYSYKMVQGINVFYLIIKFVFPIH